MTRIIDAIWRTLPELAGYYPFAAEAERQSAGARPKELQGGSLLMIIPQIGAARTRAV